MNFIVITGRLGKDPEVRTLTSGSTVANFRVAVQRDFKDNNGERGTDWLPVVVWGRQAENAGQYLHKGSKVGVTGRVQVRQYQRTDGSTAYVTEVVANNIEYLDHKADTENQPVQENPEGFFEIEEGLPF